MREDGQYTKLPTGRGEPFPREKEDHERRADRNLITKSSCRRRASRGGLSIGGGEGIAWVPWALAGVAALLEGYRVLTGGVLFSLPLPGSGFRQDHSMGQFTVLCTVGMLHMHCAVSTPIFLVCESNRDTNLISGSNGK
jgi:hypothetical protein